MTSIDFDQYARDYASLIAEQTEAFDSDNDYFVRYKVDRLQSIAPHARSILDFGCGVGRSIPFLRAAYPHAEITGSDPSAESLAFARKANPDETFVPLNELSAETRFDVIFAACVFHHIAPEIRDETLVFCRERLAPGGRIVIFEHNPLNPVTQRLVSTCPFDADAVLLGKGETAARLKRAGLEIDKSGYCLFFPGALAALRPLERRLQWLPLGGQYFVSGKSPAA